MGRVRTKLVKRLGMSMFKQYEGVFTRDFEHNKQVVGQILKHAPKKIRNQVAGYVTRLARRREEGTLIT
uniref:Small ribosomal subunit protein eS17 n=1 Tax=uncultured korarchaeote TaxID=161241 RepID=A0A1L2JM27_9CREN|nr:ribosomal protein S17E [uncultured korarchaeote]